jgi:predicted nucleotidyltransferase
MIYLHKLQDEFMNHLTEIAGALKEYLKDREEILLAFIFGSAVSGRLTAGSDLDIAVHDYRSLNVDILKSILTENLKDLEEFYTAVLKRFPVK